MRLVEIAGHNIDPRMVADVGPVRPIGTNGIDTWGFQVCASGVTIWDFIYKEGAEKIRRDLLAAIESAEQAARESLQLAPFPSDPPFSDYDGLRGPVPSDATRAKVEAWEEQRIPLSCPFDCKDAVPDLVPCRLCHVTGERERIRARTETRISPDLALPSVWGSK